MTAENHLYFPITGDEQGATLVVRLYDFNGRIRAKAREWVSAEGSDPFVQNGDEPHEVLRQAREYAALNGVNLRIELDGVDWDPELGSLA